MNFWDLLNGDSSLTLLWPWLLLLTPLPFLIKKQTKHSNDSGNAPHIPLFQTAQMLHINYSQSKPKKPKWGKILLFLSWLCLVVAASRPFYIGNSIDIPQSGRDLMLAIDISPSMKEKDLHLGDNAVTRLTVVKKVVSEFIQQRSGDRLGLILFGSQPYIQSPLSFDLSTIETLLKEAYLGMAGNSTAIGDAIALGVKRLRERPENSRVLILLSDGANTAGEIPPEKASQLAEQEKIKIYTVGIGADEMYKRSFFGSQIVNPSADLDEDMLTKIAEQTGGQYYRARSSEQLTQIYQEINKLEPVDQDIKTFRPQKSLSHIFIFIALILWLAELLLRNTSRSYLLSKFRSNRDF